MEKIDCTPTWLAVLPVLLDAITGATVPNRNAGASTKKITAGANANIELRRMAGLADKYRAGREANDALWASLQGPPVAVDAMLWAAARMLIQDNLGYNPTDEACKQIAARVFADGDNCITEDEATEFAVWFARRTDDERWAACAGADVGGTIDSPIMETTNERGFVNVRVPPVPNKVINALFSCLCME